MYFIFYTFLLMCTTFLLHSYFYFFIMCMKTKRLYFVVLAWQKILNPSTHPSIHPESQPEREGSNSRSSSICYRTDEERKSGDLPANDGEGSEVNAHPTPVSVLWSSLEEASWLPTHTRTYKVSASQPELNCCVVLCCVFGCGGVLLSLRCSFNTSLFPVRRCAAGVLPLLGNSGSFTPFKEKKKIGR